MTAKRLYCECKNCGERWAVATLPASLSVIGKLRPTCPNCGEQRKVVVCSTHGPTAVTEPRTGDKRTHGDHFE